MDSLGGEKKIGSLEKRHGIVEKSLVEYVSCGKLSVRKDDEGCIRIIFFDLYGTLVDIHTNEKKAYLWKKMSLFFGMKGAAYEPKELRMAYETKIKEQEAALKMECRGSHVPEIDIADVFRQLFEDQAVSVTEKEIADLAKMFRAISIEELKLFPRRAGNAAAFKRRRKEGFLLSNAQALSPRRKFPCSALRNTLMESCSHRMPV